jgi:hypothetical protein
MYAQGAKQPDPERAADILSREVDRTAKQAAKVLTKDVSAGADNANDPQMVDAVRANWADPQWRADLLRAQAPGRVVGWYLKAFAPEVSLAQYQKMLEADPKLTGGTPQPNTGAPPQPPVDPPMPMPPPGPPMPPAPPPAMPMAPPPMAPPQMPPPPQPPMMAPPGMPPQGGPI